MGVSRSEALSRTTRLLNEQLIGGAGESAKIASLLRDFTVQLVADSSVAATRAGQELILTANLLVRRMGMSLYADVPDVPLVAPAPPYEAAHLHAALLDVADEIIPDTPFAIGPAPAADVTFVLGNSGYSGTEPVLRVCVDGLRVTLRPATVDDREAFDQDAVLAALAASGCVASQALRAFLPRLGRACGVEIRSHSADLLNEIGIDLGELFPGLARVPNLNLGSLDFISGGAISNACLYTLLRVDGLKAGARVVEPEGVDMSNLNRYMLCLRRHVKQLKINVLAMFGTRDFKIGGAPTRMTEASRDDLLPLAARVLVGVDHVRSRWLVQREDPTWLCIGATEGFDALVSTHRPGQPCAGCIHPFPNDQPGEIIATISFVSFFAGFLQALAVLDDLGGADPEAPVIHCMPFGWDRPVIVRMPLARQAHCPVCGSAVSDAAAA